MQRYVARRLLLMIPTLLGVTFLVFLMVRSVPGWVLSCGTKTESWAIARTSSRFTRARRCGSSATQARAHVVLPEPGRPRVMMSVAMS